jgi:hypothetical protein
MGHQLGGSLEEVLMAEKRSELMAYGTTKLERANAVVSICAISYSLYATCLGNPFEEGDRCVIEYARQRKNAAAVP